jgi:hypothetical protein
MFLSFSVKLVNFQKTNVCLFLLVTIKVMHLFVLVHIDVWGPSQVLSLSGYWWFVFFIDDFSRTTWVYLLKDKNDVFSVF